MIDLTGKTLANRYDLLALIGTGGMGAVYRARDRELDEQVALKVIRADLAVMPAMAERFRHEVKLARRVTHHNVARTFELGSSDGVLFCTMELIEGESLTTRLALKRRLVVTEAVAIASAMCDALEAAHAAGVIHRDIKPDNVLIENDGRVVLADFGVAAVAAAEGELSGTPAYMAPEQARGEAPTPAADVYAVGVVLFEMLAGRRAFAGEPMTIIDAKQSLEHVTLSPADAPPELAEVIARATSRDPAARYSSAGALGHALAPWARPGRAATQPHRHAELTGVRTVYVVGTRGDARPGLYLANAVQEQLLARLRRIPLVRVLARYGEVAEAIEDDAILISVDAHETLSIVVGGTRIEVPLHIDQIGPAVELAVRAFEAELHRSAPFDPRTSEVEDMLLRARHVLLDNVRNTKAAMEMLERAHAMSPDEPRITANLAIAHVRMAFFIGESPLTSLARAVELSERAVREAPHVADSHIAAGHVALNTGNPVAAAVHFRTAIACAPHVSEAHEQLGRLLLEAGFIDTAMARLEETLRVAAGPRMVRWDIGRAWALEGRDDDYRQLETELVAEGRDRPMSRVRYLWWRKDVEKLREIRRWFDHEQPTAIAPMAIKLMFRAFLDDAYAEVRPEMLALFAAETANARRRSFVGQMLVEAAAYAGDMDTAVQALEASYDAGLFDLHWLEKCALLESLRADRRYPAIHARIKARAEAILDALYGDQAGVATQDTALATT